VNFSAKGIAFTDGRRFYAVKAKLFTGKDITGIRLIS